MTAPGPSLIIPVKPFAEAKTRLAAVLPPDRRAALARRLFAHVLDVLIDLPGRGDCLVVSRSAEVLALARARGARGVLETGDALNAAIVAAQGGLPERSVLVVCSDLPGLARADIAALLARSDHEVVVATDSHGEGTNALYLARPGLIAPQFGPRSRARHEGAARAAGLRCDTVTIPGLAADLDRPADLARWGEGKSVLA